jgi:hypothetical protein
MRPGSGIEKISSKADNAADIRFRRKTSTKMRYFIGRLFLIFFHIAGRRRAGLPED